jgi:MFS family permease
VSLHAVEHKKANAGSPHGTKLKTVDSSSLHAFVSSCRQNIEPSDRKMIKMSKRLFSPKLAFLLVSMSLGELGDGLNIFQGIYLVGRGWNEGSVGVALSLMGLTALVIQPWAGDWVDKTTVDRRIFLAVASIMTALSASAILLVREGNRDHMLIFATKIVEGITASFLGPCLAALTLATFGPNHFDAVMASNLLWGHIGSVAAAVLAGLVSYLMYPQSQFCFLVVGASALLACFFVQYLPQGDPLMGRGFAGKVAMDAHGRVEQLESSNESTVALTNHHTDSETPEAVSYWEVFADTRSVILCLSGFFFQ